MTTTTPLLLLLLLTVSTIFHDISAERESMSAGVFGPPAFVTESCDNWCNNAAFDRDAREACVACNAGPQVNALCANRECSYCEREIVFPRSYPKLWREHPMFQTPAEGKTRCWCDTGCPVYAQASRALCWFECSAVCSGVVSKNV